MNTQLSTETARDVVEIIEAIHTIAVTHIKEIAEGNCKAELIGLPIETAPAFASTFFVLREHDIHACEGDVFHESAHLLANGFAEVDKEWSNRCDIYFVQFSSFYVFAVFVVGIFLQDVYKGNIDMKKYTDIPREVLADFAFRPRITFMDYVKRCDPKNAITVYLGPQDSHLIGHA